MPSDSNVDSDSATSSSRGTIGFLPRSTPPPLQPGFAATAVSTVKCYPITVSKTPYHASHRLSRGCLGSLSHCMCRDFQNLFRGSPHLHTNSERASIYSFRIDDFYPRSSAPFRRPPPPAKKKTLAQLEFMYLDRGTVHYFVESQ